MYSINELSNKCHISIRSIEANIAKHKDQLSNTNSIVFDGQKWSIKVDAIKTVTSRKYAKHYINYDNGVLVENINLKGLIKEKELKTFLTIAPKGVKSLQKMKDIVRDVFEFYHTTYPTEIPTFYVYGIEDNTDYLNEKQNKGYHIHAVTNATFNPLQKAEIMELLNDQLGADKIHETHTVSVSPYVMGIGIGALSYTLKYNQHTGCYIK